MEAFLEALQEMASADHGSVRVFPWIYFVVEESVRGDLFIHLAWRLGKMGRFLVKSFGLTQPWQRRLYALCRWRSWSHPWKGPWNKTRVWIRLRLGILRYAMSAERFLFVIFKLNACVAEHLQFQHSGNCFAVISDPFHWDIFINFCKWLNFLADRFCCRNRVAFPLIEGIKKKR